MKAEHALKITALSSLALSLTACELVKGIFKAGVWVGVLSVLAVVIGIGFFVARSRR